MIFERNCDAIVDEFPPREPSDFLTPRLRPTCDGQDRQMSALGLVSRASPVQTAVRNCTRDEGGPFGFGDQVPISSHRKLLSLKAMVVNVAETSGHDPG